MGRWPPAATSTRGDGVAHHPCNVIPSTQPASDRHEMNNWIHSLSIVWMAVVVFAGAYVVAAAIYLVVVGFAPEALVRRCAGVSAGLLSPLGNIFGLLVAFLVAQVWSDLDRANAAVNHEASALRAVVLLSRTFPGGPDTRMRALIARHIRDARDVEWPAMANRSATLAMVPTPLAQALEVAVSLPATSQGQIAAQREMVSQLGNALDARRQRILLSQSGLDWVKWGALLAQAFCTLVAIAVVHGDKRATAPVALGLFASAIAVCIVLIAANDRPYGGQLGVRPTVLLQVQPDSLPASPGFP
jgi:hypothetical protein